MPLSWRGSGSSETDVNELTVRPNALNDGDTERDVRDEMPVHDIEMEPIDTFLNARYLGSKCGEVGGKE